MRMNKRGDIIKNSQKEEIFAKSDGSAEWKRRREVESCQPKNYFSNICPDLQTNVELVSVALLKRY